MKMWLQDFMRNKVLSMIGYECIEVTEESENTLVGNISLKRLKEVEQEWVDSFIIN